MGAALDFRFRIRYSGDGPSGAFPQMARARNCRTDDVRIWKFFLRDKKTITESKRSTKNYFLAREPLLIPYWLLFVDENVNSTISTFFLNSFNYWLLIVIGLRDRVL